MKIVTVGGGITGMFVSYNLADQGHEVVVVDRHEGEVPTSTNNAGLLNPAFTPAPKWSNYRLASAAIWPRGPLYFSPNQIIRNTGWFYSALRGGVFTSENELWGLTSKSFKLYEEFFAREKIQVDLVRGAVSLSLKREAAIETARALKGTFLEASECLDLGFQGFEGGALFDESLAINPPKLFSEMRRILTERGVRFELGKSATFEKEGARVKSVHVDGERLHGDLFVAAGGAETREILRPIGYDPRVLPALGLAMIFETGGSRVMGYPAEFEDYGIGLSQHNENTLRVTSFMELVGFKKGLPKRRKEWMRRLIKKHLRSYDKLRLVREGIGHRPCTPDQLGVVGRVPGYENLFVATGNCRVGVQLAPVTGYIIASLVNGQQPEGVDWKCLNPSRFSSA